MVYVMPTSINSPRITPNKPPGISDFKDIGAAEKNKLVFVDVETGHLKTVNDNKLNRLVIWFKGKLSSRAESDAARNRFIQSVALDKRYNDDDIQFVHSKLSESHNKLLSSRQIRHLIQDIDKRWVSRTSPTERSNQTLASATVKLTLKFGLERLEHRHKADGLKVSEENRQKLSKMIHHDMDQLGVDGTHKITNEEAKQVVAKVIERNETQILVDHSIKQINVNVESTVPKQQRPQVPVLDAEPTNKTLSSTNQGLPVDTASISGAENKTSGVENKTDAETAEGVRAARRELMLNATDALIGGLYEEIAVSYKASTKLPDSLKQEVMQSVKDFSGRSSIDRAKPIAEKAIHEYLGKNNPQSLANHLKSLQLPEKITNRLKAHLANHEIVDLSGMIKATNKEVAGMLINEKSIGKHYSNAMIDRHLVPPTATKEKLAESIPSQLFNSITIAVSENANFVSFKQANELAQNMVRNHINDAY